MTDSPPIARPGARPIACAGCSQPMLVQELQGKYGQPLVVDVCFACAVVWFDGFESALLAPGAILRVFTLMHDHRQEQQSRPLAQPKCPRCRHGLVETCDRQRRVQFHYWRCRDDHGRLTAFVEFLREKDFVRPLAPAEIAELKTRVKTVRCDGCGAAIDLEQGSVCPYCRSPVSTLDPQQVERTLHELRAAEEKRQTVDPQLGVRLAMDRLAVDRFFRDVERESNGGSLGTIAGLGLVGAGIAAVVGMMSGDS